MTRFVFAVLASLVVVFGTGVAADDSAPFKDLPGRWVGEGRIGLESGKIEKVKCRATYFVSEGGAGLRQNIRCATSGAKIEVKSQLRSNAGTLSGTWKELIYNLEGELTGKVTERGFRISVKGADMAANMEVILFKGRQVVEIQFIDSALVGLTLILTKG